MWAPLCLALCHMPCIDSFTFLATTRWSRCYYSPHFTDAEPWILEVLFLRSHSWEMGSQRQSQALWPLLFSCSVMSTSLRPHELQHTRLPCPSPSPEVCSNSCPLSQWCHPPCDPIVPFSSHLQSFPASGSFPLIWLQELQARQRWREVSFLRDFPTSFRGWSLKY